MPGRLTRRDFAKGLALSAGALGACADGGDNAVDGEWRSWGRDAGGARFSPLDQIDKENVAELRPAWTHHCGEISDGTQDGTRTAYECTPLMANGRLYVTTPYNRVLALDPETGEEIWEFDPGLGAGRRYNLWANRGAAYWTHGEERRLLYGTLDGRLIALHADDGKPCSDFGDGGEVNVGVRLTSPPAVWGDLAIIGGNVPVLRAFDVRTGKPAWMFHKVPPDDETAKKTWAGESWRNRRGGVAWPPLSVDEDRGMLFVPTDSPTYDYYGADRAGDNLYSNCVLALDAETGDRKWHFQATHHDIWDYDLCAQPMLFDMLQDGERVPMLAQTSKQGFVYVLNRETGEPIFGVDEKPVPQAAAPGEVPSPTQPIPRKPGPFVRQAMTPDELSDATPEHRAWGEKLLAKYPPKPLYHPGTEEGVIIFPCNQGGGEWGGGCFDPTTGRFFINGTNLADILILEPRDASEPGRAIGREIVTREGLSDRVTYRKVQADVRQSKFWHPETLWPCQNPPWGVLSSIDMATGEYDWQVPLGEVPELTAKGIPKTGTINMGGPIVTAGGLLFIGGSNDRRFRAFDRDTGAELWETELEGSGHANPMTYVSPESGRQFVVIAAGGGNKLSHKFTDALQAFALPE